MAKNIRKPMKKSPLLQDVYIAELLVESNVTLEAQTVMSVLNSTNNISVTSSNGQLTVSLLQNELVAGIVLEHFILSVLFFQAVTCEKRGVGWV